MLLSLTTPIALMWISLLRHLSQLWQRLQLVPLPVYRFEQLVLEGTTQDPGDERNNKIRVFGRNRETPGVRYFGICTCSYREHVHHWMTLTLSGRSSFGSMRLLESSQLDKDGDTDSQ